VLDILATMPLDALPVTDKAFYLLRSPTPQLQEMESLITLSHAQQRLVLKMLDGGLNQAVR
jgi:hypothetical protein